MSASTVILQRSNWPPPGVYAIKLDQDLSLDPEKFQISLKPITLRLHTWDLVPSSRVSAGCLVQNFEHVAAILHVLE